MSDTWQTEHCPQCQVKNWINLGDFNDLTGVDIEAIQCWRCDRKFFLDPENIQDIHWHEVQQWCNEKTEYETPDDLLEALCYECGRKNPDDELKTCERKYEEDQNDVLE